MEEMIKDPAFIAVVIGFGAVVVRLVMALIKGPVLEKLPPPIRPFVPLALSVLLAFLEHLASGGDLQHAVQVATGVALGSEVSYRVKKGVLKAKDQ